MVHDFLSILFFLAGLLRVKSSEFLTGHSCRPQVIKFCSVTVLTLLPAPRHWLLLALTPIASTILAAFLSFLDACGSQQQGKDEAFNPWLEVINHMESPHSISEFRGSPIWVATYYPGNCPSLLEFLASFMRELKNRLNRKNRDRFSVF